jgi:hypothetical protein
VCLSNFVVRRYYRRTAKKMGSSEVQPLAFKILVFLEKVPKRFKEGPWSPVAHLVLLTFLGYILLNFENASASYSQLFDVHSIHFAQNRQSQLGAESWIQYYRLFGGIYMLCITGVVFYTSGIWPLASYTLTSWNLCTIRLLSSFIAASNYSFSSNFQLVAGNQLYQTFASYPCIRHTKI